MEYKLQKWYEVSYQKRIYCPIVSDTRKFYDLGEAYECADEIKERFPCAQVWINECTLEKKEVK